MPDTQQGVYKCIAESLSLDGSELSPTTLLIRDLDADSLDVLDIMFRLEEEFTIKLEKEDFDFLRKIEMTREEAVHEGKLTEEAKKKLKPFLPELDIKNEILLQELGNLLSISAIILLVESQKK